jgi:toxin HigB-1
METGVYVFCSCLPRALLNELRLPPGNCLEALSSDRRGQHSIRINDQYRICFVWSEQGPVQVEIVDYH